MESPIEACLAELHRTYAPDMSGKVADYIPELSKANPAWFGISLATIDGHVYEVGDTRQPFTIQSISKALVYGMALEDNGRTTVLDKIGVEPTGEAFNAISLHPQTGQPANPMINAGAIAASHLVEGSTAKQKIRRILDSMSRYAGRDLTIDEPVYRSEAETGHRNRAIAHLLRNFNIIVREPEAALDAYFQQCSISITCRDLALIGATLANNGTNPLTKTRAVVADYVENILAVMSSCGMYNYAGGWIYRIGMPAKSGVGGGILAVLPGQLGIGVFSPPPLDALGNSVRGIKVCEELSHRLDLNMFRSTSNPRSVIRKSFTAAAIPSNRLRTQAATAVLRREGGRIVAFELQGPLVFSTAEVVVRDLTAAAPEAGCLVLDFRRCTLIDESSCDLIYQAWKGVEADGKKLVLSSHTHLPLLLRYFRKTAGADGSVPVLADDLDHALEWAEEGLLAQTGGAGTGGTVAPEDFDLFQGLDPADARFLIGKLTARTFRDGDAIVQIGDSAQEMFFLCSGRATVVIPRPEGGECRVSTFSPGMTFGEMGVLDQAPRSAVVRAEGTAECRILSRADFDALDTSHPALKIKLLRNLAVEFSRHLRRANGALLHLAG